MTIRLYDSRAQALRELEPRRPGAVGMYVCGPTVQSSPHIGHLRSALAYDLWRRWFTYRGLAVTFVRNVTDIDDKVLENAADREEWWALAYRMELEFSAAYRALRILPPTYEPRATASIPQMQEIIARLIARGHAYVADDESGDVYFDVRSWPDYGELTHQRIDDLADSPDAATRGKRDPRDFALWKGGKPGEPESATWTSPWGPGRPGWHIECSAMSRRYLGAAFDIHGGGLDLRFPHHENEIAQSRAAGDDFAEYWMHNGLVNVEGQKMSKSLGNSVFAAELLAAGRPIALRYLFASAHYRSTIDYSPTALAEADAALSRIESFVERVTRVVEGRPVASAGVPGLVPAAFAAAMDDDLGTPEAVAVVHDTVRSGNIALDSSDLVAAEQHREEVVSMLDVLGLGHSDWPKSDEGADAQVALGALVDQLIDERETARRGRDFDGADVIRRRLAAAGIQLEDSPTGTRWSLA